MNTEEGKTNKIVYQKRCPGIGEVFAYISVVVIFLAILIPIEFNHGFGSALLQMTQQFSMNDDTFLSSVFNTLKFIRKENDESPSTRESILTKEELKKFSGNADIIYVALLGKIYDVSSGRKHYGEEGAYSFFAGVDGSRAYATGKFDSNGLIDNIRDLPPMSYISLQKWEDAFKEKYPCIGKVNGFFYDSNGNEKEGVVLLREGLERGKLAENEEKEYDKKFPGCNSMFTQETGSEIWCTKRSGNVNRDWIGVPRRFFMPGNTNSRCACVKMELLPDPRFKEFKGCPPDFTRCKILE